MEYYILFIQSSIIIIIFLILSQIGKFILKKIENSESQYLNPSEYLPEEEVTTLRQVFYLIMMLILFVFILYHLLFLDSDLYIIETLEIITLSYILITLDYSYWKNRILFFFLIPYGAIFFVIFHEISLLEIFGMIQSVLYIYLMKIYYDKFKDYTETNSLGITIILLFTIIFISFINTTIGEDVGPFNALVMVSNAFTSNGYAILGNSSLGKLNSILLVWGGYILSGVGTATLTASILIKHFKKQEEDYKERFDKLEESFNELKELINNKEE